VKPVADPHGRPDHPVPNWTPSRVEDAPLVTGQGRFLDDLDPLPGTLVAAVVRSPHPHARIRSVDLDRARAYPGVAAVLGPAEVSAALRPFPLSTGAPMPYYPTGTDKARFVGEPVAVVVATDRYTAEDAAELVSVDYQPLPPVVGARAALAEDAPLLHEAAGSNVATDRTFEFGSVAEAFENAARVVEGEYEFPRYSSVPMECYSVIAEWRDSSGDGTVGPAVEAWANFHGPFTMVPVMAGALGLPTSRLRLHVPADIGGSFGIKAGIYPYVVLMALASKLAGAPVRWTEDRIEHLLASSSGADRIMRMRAAVDADGMITALDADLVDNVGAYLRPPEPSTLYRCFGNITGPYCIPEVRIRARAVVTNQMPTGLNRGFGGQQLYFGLERLMDAVATATGRDALDVRRRNLVGSFPYETPTGGVYDSGDYTAALELAVKNADLGELRERQASIRAAGGYYGIGVGLVVDPSGTNIGYVGLACSTIILLASMLMIGQFGLFTYITPTLLEVTHLDESQCAFGLSGEAPEPGHLIDFPGGGAAFWQERRTLDKKFVGDTERRERNLVRDFGPIRFDLQSANPDVDLDKLIVAKKEQYSRTGVNDALGGHSTNAFLRSLSKTDHPLCSGVLSTLYAGDTWVASHFGLRCNHTLHYWFPVYNPKLGSYGPGRLLLKQILNAGHEHGISRIDRGAGRGQEGAVAVTAWRQTGRRHGRLSALRFIGSTGGWVDLRRDAG